MKLSSKRTLRRGLVLAVATGDSERGPVTQREKEFSLTVLAKSVR